MKTILFKRLTYFVIMTALGCGFMLFTPADKNITYTIMIGVSIGVVLRLFWELAGYFSGDKE